MGLFKWLDNLRKRPQTPPKVLIRNEVMRIRPEDEPDDRHRFIMEQAVNAALRTGKEVSVIVDHGEVKTDEPLVREAILSYDTGWHDGQWHAKPLRAKDADYMRGFEDAQRGFFEPAQTGPDAELPKKPRHDPTDHDCKGGVPGDKYPF